MSDYAKRPVWNDESSYPKDPETWSHRHWAWEFLRRNTDYQAACKVKALPAKSEQLAQRFGRCDLKSYRKEYVVGDEDKARHWLGETVTRVAGYRKNRELAEFTLSQGEVALVFDLRLTLAGGKAVVTSLLEHAKELLADELIKFEKSLPRGGKPKAIKIHRQKLFTWLGVHDALMYSEEPKEEVAKVLYPFRFGKAEAWTKSEKGKAIKKLEADLRRANAMVKEGYLALVPLDKLQKKSTKIAKKPKASGR